MNLLQHTASIVPLSEQMKDALLNAAETLQVKKGEMLVRAGEYCHDIYFVESSLLRGYYYRDGKEIANWFTREGEFARSFYSFITHFTK